MSSTQDVRFSDAKVQQGADLANKLWNASRLILLNCKFEQDQSHPIAAQGQVPAPVPRTTEDRWILSRLEATIASVTGKLEAYDFAHAAQEAYSFFWSELCDWYLEIVKPRLYDGEEEVSATLLWALERVLALLHPIMPFVTEEIWSFHPSRRGHLAVHDFPVADRGLIDAEAEAEVGTAIDLTRRLRAWRDLVDAPAATVLAGRLEEGEAPEFVGRLSRFRFDGGGGEPVASVGPVRVLATEEIDPGAVRERLEARRGELRSEVARAEGKLGNERFVERAPPEVVAEEREKLESYRAELEELSEAGP
jgi:valyl-tRNA synthetase